MALYAKNLSTDYGTPSSLNPNDWPIVDGWHTQPSSGVRIKWVAGHDLYIEGGTVVTIGDGVDFGIPSFIGGGSYLGAGSVWTSIESGTNYIGDVTIIGENCVFGLIWGGIYDGVTIGDRVIIGDYLNVHDGVVIADDWTIGTHCNISDGTRIG